VRQNFTEVKEQLYPNPAHDLAVVEYANGGVTSIELFDVTGKKVYSQPFTIETTQFALILKDLPAGLFEVRLLNSSGDVLEMSLLIKE
jgi:thioredoxin-related protein